MTGKTRSYTPFTTGRREFMKLSSGAVSLLTVPLSTASQVNAAAGSRPNVLLIITDQQYNDTISAGGCKYVKTPALDKLMKRGTSFRISLSPNPVCCPARSSIFTGRATTETGVISNKEAGRMRKEIPNLGQWLSKQANYETVYAGKWHLPQSYTHFIPGFNVLHTGLKGQGNLCDTAVSQACAAFLHNRKKKKPFLMVTSFMQPHDICEWIRLNTYNPGKLRYPKIADKLPPLPDNFEINKDEPEYLKENRRKRASYQNKWDKQQWRYYLWSYYRHIEMVDAEIGRLLKALEDAEYKQNTLVIFTSDHGEGLGAHQNVLKSIPYREVIRVPFIISLPGRVPENKTDDTHPVSGFDIMPTVCDYIRIKPPENMCGLTLKPMLEGKSGSWRKYLVSELPGNRARVVRSKRYKYIIYAEDPVELFFDVQNDPGETKNLASSSLHASALKEHKKFLIKWEKSLDKAPGLSGSDAWKSRLEKS